MNNITNLPAYIFQGSFENTNQKVEKQLQRIFCLKSNNTYDCWCNECRKIKANQHPSIIWLKQEKEYTNKEIDVILTTMRFLLDKGKHFFFILSDAHKLTSSTANRLLKSIEEPPDGYHFILLTPNAQAIMPTIRSRCSIIRLKSNKFEEPDGIFYFFNNKNIDPLGFESALKKLNLSHSQAIELIESFAEYLRTKIKLEIVQLNMNNEKESIEENRSNKLGNQVYTKKLLDHFERCMHKPPQSGGASLFLKMIYITKP